MSSLNCIQCGFPTIQDDASGLVCSSCGLIQKETTDFTISDSFDGRNVVNSNGLVSIVGLHGRNIMSSGHQTQVCRLFQIFSLNFFMIN